MHGTTPSRSVHLRAEPLVYAYDATTPPRIEVPSGARVTVETTDARGGALSDREAGSLFPLPTPPTGRGNPLTGPIAVIDAAPGDVLAVDIISIACGPLAWIGAHAHANPLAPGRIPESLGRSCAVAGDSILYSEKIAVETRPMVGCIGLAPRDTAPNAGLMGRWGGNMDHPLIAAGVTVLLPVSVDGGLLFLGDVHARQGDGELSGVAFEVGATVDIGVRLLKRQELRCPWVLTDERIAVCTSAPEFADARREAVEEMVALIERCLGFAPADALALVSAVGDLRIGQAFGGMDLTLRLEMPHLDGLDLLSDEPIGAGG